MNKKHMITASAVAIAIASVFESGKAGWKIDADGKVELRDGNPIYVKEDGTETTIDGGTISRLNGEAKTHREAKEAAEAKLKAYEGIDPVKAKEALETVSKIDQKTLIDAGKVDEVKREITQQFQTQIAEKDAAIAEKDKRLDNMTLDNAFSKSKFIQDNVAVPAEMFQATFAKNFKVEDGKIVAIGPDGNTIYSKKRMGEIADVDEAFEIIVEAYPHKDTILKAPDQRGSGSGGDGGNRGSGRFVKRADFEKMSPGEQATTASSAQKGELSIVD